MRRFFGLKMFPWLGVAVLLGSLGCFTPSNKTPTKAETFNPDPGKPFVVTPTPGLVSEVVATRERQVEPEVHVMGTPAAGNLTISDPPTPKTKRNKTQPGPAQVEPGTANPREPEPNKAGSILTVDFDTVNFDTNAVNTGSYFIPPDSHMAAGPNHLMVVVNTTLRIHGKTGTLITDTGLASFFSSLSPVNATFDPKVLYDQYEDRWVVITLEQVDTGVDGTSSSRFLIAVSATSDPTGTWRFASFDSKLDIGGSTWGDYPGFAVDEEALYITLNMFRFSFGGNVFVATRLWLVDKGVVGGLYSGGTAVFSVVDPYPGVGFDTTTQPAHTYGAMPVGVGTMLVSYSGLSDGTDEYVQVVRVDDPLGSPSLTWSTPLWGNVDDTSLGVPNMPQSGTGITVESNDRRALDAVWRDDFLWMVATVVGFGPDAGEATAIWVKIDTSTLGSLTVADSETVGGEDIATDTHTSFPSIAVNGSETAVIGFSAGAGTIFPGAYFATITPTGGTGSSEVLRAGTDFYNRTFGGTNRWGDYSGVTLDPSDNHCFWIFNGYAGTRGTVFGGEDGRWITAVGEYCIPCSFGIDPSFAVYDENGGSGSVAVAAGTGCAWTAVSNESWISITAHGGGGGTGNGNVNYSVAANATTSQREGTLTIAGETFTVTQEAAPCVYSIDPTSADYDENGGGGMVAVTTQSGCAWTAVSNANWITITARGGGGGTGNGTVNYLVAANATTSQRVGTLTIAGETFTVTQEGGDCVYGIDPVSANYNENGGNNTVAVTAQTGCTWIAVSNHTWITITSGSAGSGDGAVAYNVAVNLGLARTGTITAAGQTFTVHQAECPDLVFLESLPNWPGSASILQLVGLVECQP